MTDSDRQSGFRLLSDNRDAFVTRIALIEKARRSLEIQYYLYHNDASGRYIAYSLLEAADRGVKVRILVDDIDLGGRDSRLKMMAFHPNIEIRIFNPLQRRNWFRRLEMVIRLDRAGRRMHNKLFIADDSFAIVGGRNIGDEYFDARKSLNFVDLDLLITGSIVGDLTKSFEDYWQSRWSAPVESLSKIKVLKSHLKNVRLRLKDFWRRYRNSEYFSDIEARDLDECIDTRRPDFMYADAHLLSDHPDKIDRPSTAAQVEFGKELMACFDSAQSTITVTSPYFVPGNFGAQWMQRRAAEGLEIQVLTNSLSATDVSFVHAGYRRYRKRLLEAGIKLYELKRDAISTTSRSERFIRHRPQASLHAKYIVIDNKQLITGSANIDPRSSNLNTEIIIAIESEKLAAQVSELFQRITRAENSYRLELVQNSVRWRTRVSNRELVYRSEPAASIWRRLVVLVTSLLPVEGLL